MNEAGVKYKFPADFYAGKPRIQDVDGRKTFTLGGSAVQFRFKRTGYLDGFLMRIDGQTDVSTAALVLLPRAPWNIFSSVKLKPRGRMQFLDSVNSHALRVVDLCTRGISPFTYGAFDRRTDGLDVNTGRSEVRDTFPTGVANDQAFELWAYVSARRSPTDPRGRIPLENDSDLVLELNPNTEANMVTVPGNWAQDELAVQIWQVTYDEVPPSPEIQPHDTNWALQITEQEQVAAVGQNEVRIEPDGSIILGVYHVVALNDLLTTSDDIDGLDFRVDKTWLVEPSTNPRAIYRWTKGRIGAAIPDGLIAYDFDDHADADGAAWKLDGIGYQPSLGRPINTAGAKEIRSRISIPTGTALGTTPRIFTYVRKLVRVGA